VKEIGESVSRVLTSPLIPTTRLRLRLSRAAAVAHQPSVLARHESTMWLAHRLSLSTAAQI